MDKKYLQNLVDAEYEKLNEEEGRFPIINEIRSNQVKALINVIANLLPEKKEVK